MGKNVEELSNMKS